MGLLAALETAKKNKDLEIDSDTIVSTEDAVEYISTGSIILDKILGKENRIGGVAQGRILEMFGLESSGKTTVALHIARETQKLGKNVVFVDFEAALDRSYARSAIGLDLDPDKFAHLRPTCLEEGVNLVDAILSDKNANVGVVIMDSVKAMLPRAVIEGLVGDEPPMALQARRVGMWLGKVTKQIKDTGTILILLNQMTKNIKSNPYQSGGEFETPGGLAIRFYASTRIELKCVKKETIKGINPITNEEDDIPDSNRVRASIIKNKVGDPYKKAEFYIKYGKGIDNVRSVIDMAVSHNVIKQGGAWFSYKETEGGFKVQGEDNMRAFLTNPENKGMLKQIADSLIFNTDEKVKEEAKVFEAQEAKMERKNTKELKKATKEKKEAVETVVKEA